MTIAVPISQERISPVPDAAARLLLVTRQRGKEVARKEVVLTPQPPEELARSVAELHVDVLLCAALSETLQRELERHGVRVRPHLCGEVESVLRAFCRGRLNRPEFRMPGCWGQHRGDGAGPGKTAPVTLPMLQRLLPHFDSSALHSRRNAARDRAARI